MVFCDVCILIYLYIYIFFIIIITVQSKYFVRDDSKVKPVQNFGCSLIWIYIVYTSFANIYRGYQHNGDIEFPTFGSMCTT